MFGVRTATTSLLLATAVGATVALAAPGPTPASAAVGPLEPQSGTWLAADGLSKVKIGPCGAPTPTGQVYCATIVWVKPPTKPEEQDAFDKKRKFVGTNISSDLRHAEDNLLVGSILDPNSGKTYNAKIRSKSASALEMGGCILGGLLCGSETWSRAADEVTPAAATGRPATRGQGRSAAKTTPGATPAADTQQAAEE